MLKALVIALVSVALLASPVLANQCPLLIKQLNNAVGKMKADDPEAKARVDAGKLLTAEAQKLHEAGNHPESVEERRRHKRPYRYRATGSAASLSCFPQVQRGQQAGQEISEGVGSHFGPRRRTWGGPSEQTAPPKAPEWRSGVDCSSAVGVHTDGSGRRAIHALSGSRDARENLVDHLGT